MTVQGRGRLPGVEIRSGTYRPRRRGPSTLRGFVVIVLLAVVVVGGAVVVAGPAFRDFARGMARDNPQTLNWPFISDVIKSDLGASLNDPIGTEATPIEFSVTAGQTTSQIAQSLADAGLISDPLVFEYLVITQNLDGKNQVGTYSLNKTMTPSAIVARLQQPPDPVVVKVLIGRPGIGIRTGSRIEQLTALLECGVVDTNGNCQVPPKPYAQINAQDFYNLALHPDAYRSDYPWMSVIPQGNSIEGFLGSGTIEVDPTTNADQLMRILLDKWTADMQAVYAQAAADPKVNFYDVMVLASIVEREAKLDSDRAQIAGVYTNRLKGLANGVKLLNSEPTVIYAVDTGKLRAMPITDWPTYLFWGLLGVADLTNVAVPADLASFQTWQSTGLPDWPITSPSLASIQAALAPDTSGGYIYFFAKCDGSGGTWFEKTAAEHAAHIAQCAGK